MFAQKRQQAFRGGTRSELLEVVVAAVIGEVHHALHDHGIEVVLSLSVRKLA